MPHLSPKIEKRLNAEGRSPWVIVKEIVRLTFQKHAGHGYSKKEQIQLLRDELKGQVDPNTENVMFTEAELGRR